MDLKFIEEKGIKVDTVGLREEFEKVSLEITLDTIALNETLISQGFPQIRPSSTEDISKLLQVMSVKLDRKTRSGKFAVDQDTLGKIDSPVTREIVRIRKLIKEKGYMARMLTSSPTGWVHCKFIVDGCNTGRIYAKDPNLMSMPEAVRKFLVAEKMFWNVDFKSEELFILAKMTGSETLKNALCGNDVHKWAASIALGKPENEITDEERKLGKVINYGLVYGLEENGLQFRLNLSKKKAKEIMTRVLENLGVENWMAAQKLWSLNNDFVETFYGRKMPLDKIGDEKLSVENRQAKRARRAVNYPIQGCLQAHVRVLTNKGYVPIKELYEKGVKGLKAWTGVKWVDFEVLNRGVAQLARLRFVDGRVLDCDVRHEVLCHTMRGNARCRKIVDLPKGARVCSSMPAEIEFEEEIFGVWRNRLPIRGGHCNLLTFEDKDLEEIWYWVGYYIGDGWNDGKAGYGWVFGRKDLLRAEMLKKFLLGKAIPFSFRKSIGSLGDAWSVDCHTKAWVDFLREVLGCSFGSARTKRLPERIWRSSLKNRKAFLKGLWDADGSKKSGALHLKNYEILKEIQVLSYTGGRVYYLGGPYRDGSSQLSERGLSYRGRCWAKYYAGYYFAVVKSVEVLERREETYTLSVKDESHVFDSGSIISKNTAADILRNILDKLRVSGLPVRMVNQDSVLIDGTAEEAKALVGIMSECGKEFNLSVEVKTATNWRDAM